VSDDGLHTLVSLSTLTDLNLSMCRQVSDDGFRTLAGFTALTSLNLSYYDKVSNNGLQALAGLTALTLLNLEACHGVSDNGLQALTSLAALTARVCPTSFEGFPPTSHDPERCSTTPPSGKGCRTSFRAPRCLRGPCAWWGCPFVWVG
jgi:hypothetical protein